MDKNFDLLVNKASFKKDSAKKSVVELARLLKKSPQTIIGDIKDSGEICIAKNKSIKELEKIESFLNSIDIMPERREFYDIKDEELESFLEDDGADAGGISAEKSPNDFDHASSRAKIKEQGKESLRVKVVGYGICLVVVGWVCYGLLVGFDSSFQLGLFSPGKDEIVKTLRNDIPEKVAERFPGAKVSVKSLDLIKVDSGNYKGVITLLINGIENKQNVEVWTDGGKILWKASIF